MELASAELQKLDALLSQSRNMLFLGGAGVSTESGIPDFRSRSAAGACKRRFGFEPQTILSAGFLNEEPELFFSYYNDFLQKALSAQPNAAHRALAEIEARGRLNAVITQNIDELHERAGSKRVLKLHGSIGWNRCENCAAAYPADFMLHSDGVPRCTRCGARVRPEVVLYDEPLDDYVLRSAKACMFSADTLLLAGSSLKVYPAAALPEFFMGKHLIIINKSRTPFDKQAELLLRAPVAAVFEALGY